MERAFSSEATTGAGADASEGPVVLEDVLTVCVSEKDRSSSLCLIVARLLRYRGDKPLPTTAAVVSTSASIAITDNRGLSRLPTSLRSPRIGESASMVSACPIMFSLDDPPWVFFTSYIDI